MPVVGIYHVNVNVSDLERSRAFYEKLGFRVLEEFREANNANLDAGLGLARSDTRAYFLRAGNDRRSTLIDLVEWREPPLTGSPPSMSHVGPVRIALRVQGLDAMYESLRADGVEFLSSPRTLEDLPTKPRFVCLRDPDGTLIELVEF